VRKEKFEELMGVLRDSAQRSETAHAVVAAARVENWLQAAILTRMRAGLSKTVRERLFKGYGPLSSFSGKIDIAYAFSMFGPQTYNDLRAIKDIRNTFAHSNKEIHFRSDIVMRNVQKLTGWTKEADPINLFFERCKAGIDELKKHSSTDAMTQALTTIAEEG
jgi:DNA-binding MltR family transcriptional regulator